MAISYFAENVKMPPIKRREITRWIKRIAAGYDKKIGEINYIFCSDDKILSVNREYLQHDYYTDIITFDYCENNKLSGDLFISVDTVQSNADQYGTEYNEEIHRIIIHGILHLCGQNDKSPEERETMTQKENTALALLSQLRKDDDI
ncbi:MAG: rRNA maturation RNase YbeY [Bacteroidales bacterium]|nr:rRNA maturation RNase YbeY [Bacteroidales bacterium]